MARACFRDVTAFAEFQITPPAARPAEDARYRRFFELFNAGAHFEAHEALEPLWLRSRGKVEADFYKALIQCAGALVHLQKGHAGPGAALARRAHELLSGYPDTFHDLDVPRLRAQLLRLMVSTDVPVA